MSKFLQNLLGAEGPMFSKGLSVLEKSTGNSGIDARLIADITEKAHQVMRRLCLDVRDTSGEELYYALIESIKTGEYEQILVDSDYVLISIDGKVISLNMIDAIENTHHELPFAKQIISHGQRALRGELVSRYESHSRTDKSTTHVIARSIGLLHDDG